MEDISKFKSPEWQKYLERLLYMPISPPQESCKHLYTKLPKSGYLFGIPLWRCPFCERVVQSM